MGTTMSRDAENRKDGKVYLVGAGPRRPEIDNAQGG